MTLFDKIKDNRKELLERWQLTIVEMFPKSSRRFITTNNNRFSNPAGFIVNDFTVKLFNRLFIDKSVNGCEEDLVQIIKLKAANQNKSNISIEFLFSLKKITREFCDAYSENFSNYNELFQIEDNFDYIIMRAHELYIESRDHISKLKIDEIIKQTYMLNRVLEKNGS